MIPKIIHYCWFGGNPLPENVKKCIASWRKFLPDYEIKEWNESNYNVHKNQYMSDAYKEKKWAFVSDYARIDVIYENGGIYLDTDVEVVRNFDDLLKEEMFCGFESRDPIGLANDKPIEYSVNLGLGYGAVSKHPVLKDILNFYSSLSFYNEDGSLNLIACPRYQTQVLLSYGLVPNNQTQRLRNAIVYSPEYFCPQSNITDSMICFTDKTYSIHHFTMSWSVYGPQVKLRNKLMPIIGYKLADLFSRVIFIPYKLLKR